MFNERTMVGVTSMLVNNVLDPILEKIEQTYIDSFPVEERRDFVLLRKLIEEESRFNVYVFLKENEYVGFITAWRFDEFTYVEHFAIDESARNGGIGRMVLKEFLMKEDAVVLEVELPEDEMSKRRIGFYQRLGFSLDTNPYKQPPYRDGEDWVDLVLMSFGNIDLSDRFEHVKEYIYKYVYGYEG